MKPHTWKWMPVVSLITVLAMPIGMAAQNNPSPSNNHKHHTYKLIDLGTLGGPNSFISTGTAQLTNGGTLVGEADTVTPDPYAPNCLQFSCLVNHAFSWNNGVKTDLGALPGPNSSTPFTRNARGQTIGGSENGQIDPLTGLPVFRGVLWQQGQIIEFGTFGGNNSLANGLNSRGQVVGGAQNNIPDAYASCNQPFIQFYPTQVHAFSWQDGKMRDLGTLGGNDSCAFEVNDQGQVAGFSYTNTAPNPNTGVPSQDPFLWERGKMTDLGTLGGTYGVPNWLNNHGQVVGFSNMPGDWFNHPFFWDKGVLTDMGTLGGYYANASVINDAGQAVGISDLADFTHHAFVWWKGKMTDVGTVSGDPCSNGFYINASGQVVGTSTDCHGTVLHAFLWEHGSMVNLNAYIGPDFAFVEPFNVNDRGEIAGNGVFPNGDVHVVLLVPNGDCDDQCEGRIAASQNSAIFAPNVETMTRVSESSLSPVEKSRMQMRQRYHMPGQVAKRNN